MEKTMKTSLGDLQLHPLDLQLKGCMPNLLVTFSEQNLRPKTPLTIVPVEGDYYLIDGWDRFCSAIEMGTISTLECKVSNIPDYLILDANRRFNYEAKMPVAMLCEIVKHELNSLVANQLKRNELSGTSKNNAEYYVGTSIDSRLDVICLALGLDFSSRTLRKLLTVYEYEKTDNSLHLLDGIDDGIHKISKAYKLMKSNLKIGMLTKS
jgi:hypothetical protein